MACRSPYASLLACQMPVKSGLPSMYGPGACYCPYSESPIDRRFRLVTATAAMTPAKPLMRARMTSPLSQRIGVVAIVGKPAGEPSTRAETQGGRVWTFASGDARSCSRAPTSSPAIP